MFKRFFLISQLSVLFITTYTNAIVAFQLDTISVLGKKEIVLVSDSLYQNPHSEVIISVEFYGPNKEIIKQTGFWDGGNIFKVRFAPPENGLWSYSTSSNDPQNIGLNKTGTFYVENYEGDDVFRNKGWLKVSESGRFLEYGDGTPFFYLGDTAWEMGWKSTREELSLYLDDRESKGFTVIHTVPLSHQYLSNNGRRNRYGEDFFIDEDFSKINPRYFDYIDEIVDSVNNRGMIAALVPLWGWLNELHRNPDWGDNYIDIEQSKMMARYIASRYAANNIVWIIGGDDRYNTPERKSFWDEFARIIKKSTGWRQLATLHPRGWSASFDYFDSNTEWLDFHMYQSSHLVSANYVYKTGERGYNLTPIKPVINGEPNYEDIYNDLKNPDEENAFRITPKYVREAAYQSILSGATMGINYGANGVWQWASEFNQGSHHARDYAIDAIEYPGSAQMKLLKNLMMEVDWYDFEPSNDYVSIQNLDKVVITASTKKHVVSYFPVNLRSKVNYSLSRDIDVVSARFMNPSTGEVFSHNLNKQDTIISVSPPDTMDWVFVLEKENKVVEKPTSFQLYQNFPNPFNPNTIIEYYLDKDAMVQLTVFDSIGREVAALVNENKVEGFHVAQLSGQNLASGIYFYRLVVDGNSITKKMTLVK